MRHLFRPPTFALPRALLRALLRALPRPAALLLVFAALAAVPGAVSTAATAAEPLKILAFGDSLVHGYGLGPGEPFPAQLEARLEAEGYENVEIVNAGNSGDTTAAGLARLDWALAENPDAVILVLGANDGLRGIEPSNTYENLDGILAKLRAQEIPVLLTGMMAPRNLGQDYAQEFDAVFERLTAEYDTVYFPFFLQDVATVAALNQPDGIHPNAEGVATIVDNILPKVEALIERVRGQTGAPS